MVCDTFVDPLTYAKFHGSDSWKAGYTGFSTLDLRATHVVAIDAIERTSIDTYAAEREAYRQYRNAEINDGAPNTNGTPEN